MDGDDRRRRARSFLLGGLVGASAALATVRRRRALTRHGDRGAEAPAGLAAFESAPCFRELGGQDGRDGGGEWRSAT